MILSSNTNASRLMKLYTHIRHDAPCLLRPTATAIDSLFTLGWTMFRLCLAPFLKHQGLYAKETLYSHTPWHTLPTAIDLVSDLDIHCTFHALLNNVYFGFSSVSGILRHLHLWNFIQTFAMTHPAHCHQLLLILAYFSRLAEQCFVSAFSSFSNTEDSTLMKPYTYP